MIQDGIGEKLALAIQFSSASVYGLIVAFYYVWQLALLLCGVVPAIVIILGSLVGLLTKSTEASNNAYNAAGSVAQESLAAIRTLMSLGNEPRVAKAYAQHLEHAEAAGIRRWLGTGSMAGSISCVMWLAYALGLWFGAYLISADMMAREECRYYFQADGTLHQPASNCVTGGNVMICFFCVLFGGFNLGQSFPSISAIEIATTELAKILAITQLSSSIDPLSPLEETLTKVEGAIELQQVVFANPACPERNVYNGLSLRIEAGQTVALVGPSGCGKSTVVSLLQRFYDPCGGRVLLDGHDIRGLRVSWVREQMGLVSQEPVLFSGSIMDNILYGKQGASEAEAEAAARMANAHEFIEKISDGYRTEVGEKGIQLSGGQKQRIASEHGRFFS